MNQEKIPQYFKGQDKTDEEAHKIDEAVNAYSKRPRVKKERSADDVAHEIIKENADTLIPYKRFPDDLKEWIDNMRNAGIRILEDGFLEISRWDNTGKNFAKPKLMKQRVDGINSAIRMQDHILLGYHSQEDDKSREYSKIESIQEVIEYANELLNRWGTVEPELKKDMQWQLADIVLQLELCRNEFKVRVKNQAATVMNLKDSLNRENPSALAARTVAALNNLTKRMNEMQLIAPIMALRKEVLILEKRRSQGALRKADRVLSGVLSHAVFSSGAKTKRDSRIKNYEVEILDRKIGQAAYFLDMVYVAPYLQQAEQAKFLLLNKSKKSFKSKKALIDGLDHTRKSLEEARLILKSNVEHLG